MQGMSNFEIDDEAFFRMTWSENPKIHVLATAPMPSTGEVVPQIWTYERRMFGGAASAEPFRAFVWMQGHTYANFADPKVQPMILRGIAWAAKAPVDALHDRRPARGGGGGGQAAAARRASWSRRPGRAAGRHELDGGATRMCSTRSVSMGGSRSSRAAHEGSA